MLIERVTPFCLAVVYEAYFNFFEKFLIFKHSSYFKPCCILPVKFHVELFFACCQDFIEIYELKMVCIDFHTAKVSKRIYNLADGKFVAQLCLQ